MLSADLREEPARLLHSVFAPKSLEEAANAR
jgi:hypothetical protein